MRLRMVCGGRAKGLGENSGGAFSVLKGARKRSGFLCPPILFLSELRLDRLIDSLVALPLIFCMSVKITTAPAQPDLVPIVAQWLHDAFSYPGSRAVDEIIALLVAPLNGPEETFVLFEDDMPVGTASLAHDDLAARPDLTPWMTGVVVLRPYRGRGLCSRLGAPSGGLCSGSFCVDPMALHLDRRSALQPARVGTCGDGTQSWDGGHTGAKVTGWLIIPSLRLTPAGGRHCEPWG